MSIEPEVQELDQLMRLCKVGVGESSDKAGIAESNWRRWRNGVSPNMGKFRKFRVAAVDIAVAKGFLPDDCHHLPMAELIDMAKKGVTK